MKLTVLIPVYNEASTIADIVTRVRSIAAPGRSLEIIVVDDGSNDGTAGALERLAGPDLMVVRQPDNRGKGAALRAGLVRATGDVVVVQDADLEYDPSDIPAVIEPIVSQGAPVVYGSRILGRNPHSYLRYYYGGRAVTWAFNALYGGRLTDLTTCYKAFRRETLQGLPLTCTGFEFCPEVTALLALRRIPIREVPIGYRPRSLEQGKKIRWTDGIRALATLARLRLAGPWKRGSP
ncbi:MAG: glycosyltransferase family 2 protein [Candidatus Polarisedimenticolia bacterium]